MINRSVSGKTSFGGKCLHAFGETPNPYEKAIFVIGQTLAPFDEDNLIPCFGFGDCESSCLFPKTSHLHYNLCVLRLRCFLAFSSNDS